MLFKDSTGREWSTRISALTLNRWEELKIEFSIEKLVEQPSIFPRILWHTVEPQAKRLNVSDEDFYDSLDGRALEEALVSFVQDYINFTRPSAAEVMNRVFRERLLAGRKQVLKALETLSASATNSPVPSE